MQLKIAFCISYLVSSVKSSLVMTHRMKSAVLLFLCVSAVVGVSKRSSRWDAYLNHLHSKRQTQCNWQSTQTTTGVHLAGC